MRPPFYATQLRRDLDEWIARGLVPASSRDAILASIDEGTQRRSLATVLAVLGVVLLGAGVISFVAANWDAISKFTRLVILFGGMAASYAGAWALFAAKRDALAHAAVLLGVLIFGANISLVAQTYHINADADGGIALWALGALAAALIVPSQAALAATFSIAALWTWYVTIEPAGPGTLRPEFFIVWIPAFLLAGAQRWNAQVHLGLLALIFWLLLSTPVLADTLGLDEGAPLLFVYFAVFAALWLVGRMLGRTAYPFASHLQRYGIFFFAPFFFLTIELSDDSSAAAIAACIAAAVLAGVALAAAVLRDALKVPDAAVVAAAVAAGLVFALVPLPHMLGMVLVLGIIVWGVSLGSRDGDPFVINLHFVWFGLWVAWVYFEVFTALLDQALFFIVGGIVLIVASVVLDRVRRQVLAGAEARS